MHEIHVYKIFKICETIYRDNSDQQYITTAQSVIIVDIQEYKTLVKKLATIDFEIMDLVKRRQEITHLQSIIIKECKNIDIKLDNKIVQKCTLEKAKFAMLPSINMPPNTSPHAQQFATKNSTSYLATHW